MTGYQFLCLGCGRFPTHEGGFLCLDCEEEERRNWEWEEGGADQEADAFRRDHPEGVR